MNKKWQERILLFIGWALFSIAIIATIGICKWEKAHPNKTKYGIHNAPVGLKP